MYVSILKYTLLLFLSFFSITGFGQMGGSRSYSLLNMPTSSVMASTGGYSVSLNTKEPGVSAFNPSLIDSTYSGEFASAWGAIFMSSTDISYGYTSYAHTFRKWNFAGSISIINYGKIAGYDEHGESSGTLYANDVSACASVSRDLTKWLRVGMSLKPLFSYLTNYSSSTLASDIGITIHDSVGNINGGFVIRNIGGVIKPYTSKNRESLPFEIDLGYSHKLSKAPFRITATYRNIQIFDLSYDSKIKNNFVYIQDTTKETSNTFTDFAEMFMRHIIIGTEILFGKRMYIAVGYNIKRRAELKTVSQSGLIGFTYGAGINISKFKLSFAHQRLNTTGGSTLVSLQCNINNIMKATYNRAKAHIETSTL